MCSHPCKKPSQWFPHMQLLMKFKDKNNVNDKTVFALTAYKLCTNLAPNTPGVFWNDSFISCLGWLCSQTSKAAVGVCLQRLAARNSSCTSSYRNRSEHNRSQQGTPGRLNCWGHPSLQILLKTVVPKSFLYTLHFSFFFFKDQFLWRKSLCAA